MLRFLRKARDNKQITRDTLFTSREDSYKSCLYLQKLDKQDKLWDALKFVFGPKLDTLSQSKKFKDMLNIQSKTLSQDAKIMNYSLLTRSQVWNTLLSILSKRGLSEHCFKIYRKMKDMQVHPTSETFTLLFKGTYIKLSKFPPAEGLPPDKIPIYGKAKALFTVLQEKYPDLFNIYHVNTMFQCCSRAKDYQFIFHTFDKVDKKSSLQVAQDANEQYSHCATLSELKPTAITYSILLSTCATIGGDGGCNKAIEIWKDLKDRITRYRGQNSQDVSGQSQSPKKDEPESVPAELFSLDTDLVNSMIFACSKAESLSKVVNAFIVGIEELGDSLDLLTFIEKHKSDTSFATHSKKIMEKLADTKSKLVIPSHAVSDSKTAFIFLEILHEKLKADIEILWDFYQNLTSNGGNFKKAPRDIGLKMYILKALFERKAFDIMLEVFEEISKDCRKSGHLVKKYGEISRCIPSNAFQVMLKYAREVKNLDLANKLWKEQTDSARRGLIDLSTNSKAEITYGSFINFASFLSDAGEHQQCLNLLLKYCEASENPKSTYRLKLKEEMLKHKSFYKLMFYESKYALSKAEVNSSQDKSVLEKWKKICEVKLKSSSNQRKLLADIAHFHFETLRFQLFFMDQPRICLTMKNIYFWIVWWEKPGVKGGLDVPLKKIYKNIPYNSSLSFLDLVGLVDWTDCSTYSPRAPIERWEEKTRLLMANFNEINVSLCFRLKDPISVEVKDLRISLPVDSPSIQEEQKILYPNGYPNYIKPVYNVWLYTSLITQPLVSFLSKYLVVIVNKIEVHGLPNVAGLKPNSSSQTAQDSEQEKTILAGIRKVVQGTKNQIFSTPTTFHDPEDETFLTVTIKQLECSLHDAVLSNSFRTVKVFQGRQYVLNNKHLSIIEIGTIRLFLELKELLKNVKAFQRESEGRKVHITNISLAGENVFMNIGLKTSSKVVIEAPYVLNERYVSQVVALLKRSLFGNEDKQVNNAGVKLIKPFVDFWWEDVGIGKLAGELTGFVAARLIEGASGIEKSISWKDEMIFSW